MAAAETQPAFFRMKSSAPLRKWLVIFVLAALAIAAAFYWDGAVRAWVTAHPNRGWSRFMHGVGRFGDWPEHVLVGILIIAFAWWRGSKAWVRIGLAMILACALAGIAARGAKIATGRARPSVRHEHAWHGPRLSSKYNSFPSGHTAASTAFFGVLLFVRRKIGIPLLAIPLLIAASRMYVAAHYLSDVVVAAILGLFCAWLCARWRPPAIGNAAR